MLDIHFAPLQGFTESPYRSVHQALAGGIATYYTPFIRLEHGRVRPKDLREVRPESNQGVHVVPQIIAKDIEEFVTLSHMILEMGYDEIDFNMGCPFPLQVRQGRGSGLLPHIDHVETIGHEISRMTASGIHVSVKMRLGQENVEEGQAVLDVLNDCGLSHLTLHPRLGKEQYKGELHMDDFQQFLSMAKMPVIYNGGIETPEDIQKIEQLYPTLAGVMIGRGLLGRPTLAREYQLGSEMSEQERRRAVMAMYRKLREYYEQHIEGGQGQLLMKMQSFWEYLEPQFGHKAIKKVLKAGSLRNFDEAVANLPK